jgi:hypothetical protein
VTCLTENHQLRYLVGYKWNVKLALQELLVCEKYRKDMQFRYVTVSMVQPMIDLGVFYQRGFDKDGRPVVIKRCGRFNGDGITV